MGAISSAVPLTCTASFVYYSLSEMYLPSLSSKPVMLCVMPYGISDNLQYARVCSHHACQLATINIRQRVPWDPSSPALCPSEFSPHTPSHSNLSPLTSPQLVLDQIYNDCPCKLFCRLGSETVRSLFTLLSVLLKDISVLQGVTRLLFWDQEVMMLIKAATIRAEQVSNHSTY